MRPLTIILFLSLAACAKSGDTCLVNPVVDQTKAGVLIVGDSISMGYTPYVVALVQGAEVSHSVCNDQSSSYGRGALRIFLGFRPHWKLITINHGYWDMPGNPQTSSTSDYALNLRSELEQALRVSDHVIYVTTTAVIPAWTLLHPGFDNTSIQAYNSAGIAVATSLGIPVLDLYTVSLGIPDRDASVLHFTPSGSQVLANAVYAGIQSTGGIN